MTQREFFTNVAYKFGANIERLSSTMRSDDGTAIPYPNFSENEIKEFALNAIAKMDERAEKRNAMPSKKTLENEPIKNLIMAFIAERGEKCLASAIGEAVEISTSKASALCRQLVADGKLIESEVKIPKAGVRKVYALPDTEIAD